MGPKASLGRPAAAPCRAWFSCENGRSPVTVRPRMAVRSLLLVVLAAAVLGAAGALAVAKATGWLGTTTNATYVIKEQPPAAPAAVAAVAKPLAASFQPARIYA